MVSFTIQSPFNTACEPKLVVMIEAVICFFVLCCFSVIHMSRFQWAEKHMMTETTTNQTPLIQNLEGETSLFHCKNLMLLNVLN